MASRARLHGAEDSANAREQDDGRVECQLGVAHPVGAYATQLDIEDARQNLPRNNHVTIMSQSRHNHVTITSQSWHSRVTIM